MQDSLILVHRLRCTCIQRLVSSLPEDVSSPSPPGSLELAGSAGAGKVISKLVSFADTVLIVLSFIVYC